jgi:hypothetical protein
MLTFTYLGHSTVRITGAAKPIAFYPQDPSEGEISLITKPQENASSDVISWPGEYDVAGVTVRGIGQEEGQQVSFVIEADGTRVAYPSVPYREWTSEQIELLGDVHVLLLSAEDAKACQKLIDDIDPRVLIIVPTKDESTDNDVLKATGAQGKEIVSEYKLKGALPMEGREIVLFGK